MAKPTSLSFPGSKALRKRKNYNNGGANIHAPQRRLSDALTLEANADYNAQPTDSVTKRDPNGSFYRLGWTMWDEKSKSRIPA